MNKNNKQSGHIFLISNIPNRLRNNSHSVKFPTAVQQARSNMQSYKKENTTNQF